MPKDLLGHYGRAELKVALRTSDPIEAKRRVLEESLRYEREFEGVRKAGLAHIPRDTIGQAPGEVLARANPWLSDRLTEIRTIDGRFIDSVCYTHLRSGLDEDAASRAEGGAAYVDVASMGQAETLAILKECLAIGNVAPIREFLRIVLSLQGYRIIGNPENLRRLEFRFMEAHVRLIELLTQRDAGGTIDLEAVAPLRKTLMAEDGKPNIPIIRLFENWRNSGTRRPKTIDEYRSCVEHFASWIQKHHRVTHAGNVTRAEVVAYRNALVASGLSYKTVGKRIGVIRTVFGRAVDEGLIVANPCDRVKVDRPHVREPGRYPFTVQDMQQIFATNVFRGGATIDGCGAYGSFWLPLLALYSGARLEEMAQLLVSDVREDPSHGWYFSVDPQEGKTVKTQSSIRDVPIHPALIKWGFIRFVEDIRKKGERQLFPDLATDKYDRHGSAFSKKWNRHLRKVAKVEHRKKSFHSFRHSFKQHCRACDIPEEIADALTGHRSASTEGRKYGRGEKYPLGRLALYIKNYEVKGLAIEGLQAPSVR